MADCKHYQALIAGLLDGELSADENRELNEHLIRCASCRSDYEGLAETDGKLRLVSTIEPADDVARTLWKLPYSRTARNASLVMIIGGYLVLLLYALAGILAGNGEDFWHRLAGGAIIIGFLVLLGLVGVERLLNYQKDPYKEIER